jgi:membrane protease YdiL (CAAX protease family)
VARHGRALVALFFVAVVVGAFRVVDDWPWPIMDSAAFAGALKVLLWVVPAVALSAALNRSSAREALRGIGLDSAPGRGLWFGVLATVPMAAAAPFALGGHPGLDALFGTVLLGPLAEEVLFRGFLLSELRRAARWPPLAAILVSGVAFGVAHLDGHDLRVLGDALAVAVPSESWRLAGPIAAEVAITTSGGLLFGWLFYRWRSLWPAIGLHACINLWWTVSRSSDLSVVLTPDLPGVAQVASLGLALVLTVRARQRVSPSASAA